MDTFFFLFQWVQISTLTCDSVLKKSKADIFNNEKMIHFGIYFSAGKNETQFTKLTKLANILYSHYLININLLFCVRKKPIGSDPEIN